MERMSATGSIRPLPKHWQLPNKPLQRTIFKFLCICSHGHSSLDAVWAVIESGDESKWSDFQRQTSHHQNNILVVAGLLVATAATFITTSPPKELMVNYTLRGPYICFLGAFGVLLGGIIVTTVCILATEKVTAHHAKKVLYGSRIRLYCMLTIQSYPYLSIGSGTLLLAFGFLTAIWCAEDVGIQIFGVFMHVLPISMAFLFGIASVPVNLKPEAETTLESTVVICMEATASPTVTPNFGSAIATGPPLGVTVAQIGNQRTGGPVAEQ